MKYFGEFNVIASQLLHIANLGNARAVRLVNTGSARYPVDITHINTIKLDKPERVDGPDEHMLGQLAESITVSVAESGGVEGQAWKVYREAVAGAGVVQLLRTDAGGHLATVPAGAVPLFDLDTRVNPAAFRDIAEMRPDGTPGNGAFYITPTQPGAFSRITDPEAPPAHYIREHSPAWDVARFARVLFLVEIQTATNAPTGTDEAPEGTPPDFNLTASIEGCLTPDGAPVESYVMGNVADLANADSFIGPNGRTCYLMTGSSAPADTDLTREVGKRPVCARFRLDLAENAVPVENYEAPQRFLRVAAFGLSA